MTKSVYSKSTHFLLANNLMTETKDLAVNLLGHTNRSSPQPNTVDVSDAAWTLDGLYINIATPVVIISTNRYFSHGYFLCASRTPRTIIGIGFTDLPNTFVVQNTWQACRLNTSIHPSIHPSVNQSFISRVVKFLQNIIKHISSEPTIVPPFITTTARIWHMLSVKDILPAKGVRGT